MDKIDPTVLKRIEKRSRELRARMEAVQALYRDPAHADVHASLLPHLVKGGASSDTIVRALTDRVAAAKADARHAQEAALAANARKRKPRPRVRPAVRKWIEQRAKQFDETARRYGARRIWIELRKGFAEGDWTGVADAPPSYRTTCKIVQRVRRSRKIP